ncbi:thioredoxin family protein [Paenibacillus sp. OV219]|uniref:thioredoxin family protein n=1 Tax=Paenibacillus sp. OV219 TaxID=1884377 RepID=UPI0008D6B7B8|nr:thioredoxin family protein [Paenibacillus sp. OV219]SEN95072.1 Thioredoxin [Paenibacillus sp. OV219]
MTLSETSNLSQERRERAFQEAVSFGTFIEQAQVNQQALAANFEAYAPDERQLDFLNELQEPVDVLVLAHDWCGDVVANLPLFGKIAERTDKLRLHILNRDPDNQDIADLYKHADGRNHIPTYVFFDGSGQELGVFIERPAEISALLGQWIANFWTDHPELEGRGKPISSLEEAERKELLHFLKLRRTEVIGQEQNAILREIQSIISR